MRLSQCWALEDGCPYLDGNTCSKPSMTQRKDRFVDDTSLLEDLLPDKTDIVLTFGDHVSANLKTVVCTLMALATKNRSINGSSCR